MDLPVRTLPELHDALRARRVSAAEVAEEALAAHRREWNAYIRLEPDEVRAAAARADRMLAELDEPPPLCGVPVSVKDLYGMDGVPTMAGTSRVLPDAWSRDAWLVRRLREQGAVFTGKTHTVELAFGGVGMNPHHGTPWNPRDRAVHRIPGGSSAGAGVSLVEGSAWVALGTDTGGSIRIPASMTGTVGHKTTQGRWPTDGVVPLSSTLDTVGALTRSVEDAAFFFGAVGWGDPVGFLAKDFGGATGEVRFARPDCALWRDCQPDLVAVLEDALTALEGAGWTPMETDGTLLDEAADFYLASGIAAAECSAFLDRELPEWWELLDPTVSSRLQGAPSLDSQAYRQARVERERRAGQVETAFGGADLLVLPGHLVTPPPVAELAELARYKEVNRATLLPTCCGSALGLCGLTLPVGTDAAGMPVGLQLVARSRADERLLEWGRRAEAVLGRPTS